MATATYRTLAEHPNSAVICDVLTRIPQITDTELGRLAEVWRDSLDIATARAAALAVDGPLVLDALAAFDAVAEVFADDLAGKPWGAPLQRSVVRLALKAVRDAVAAAYARPAISSRHYAALMAPWQLVFTARCDAPGLGPSGDAITRLLAISTQIGQRCHDPAAAGVFQRLLTTAVRRDQDFAAIARQQAWDAALLTGRRRTRVMLRRALRDAMVRHCPTCTSRPEADDEATERVLELVCDAAWGLLVSDTLDETMLEILTLPLSAHLDRDTA